MLKQSYSEKLCTSDSKVILHQEDWKLRLGEELFNSFVEKGGLIKPEPSDIDGKVLTYHNGNVFFDVDVLIEDDTVVLDPVSSNFQMLKKNIHDINLLKFSIAEKLSYIRNINFLKFPEFELVNNSKVHPVGELSLKKKRILVLFSKEEVEFEEGSELLGAIASIKNTFVILLSPKVNELVIKDNFVFVPYRSLSKIPIGAFNIRDLAISGQVISATIKYPLFIDRKNKYIFVFGEKLGVKKDTNIYKFISSIEVSHSSLPMDTEMFFNMHDITKEHYESAIKEIRSQVKEKVELTKLTEEEKKYALKFFDLVSEEKTRGAIDFKLPHEDIQVW